METSLKRGGEGESGTEKIESVSETQNSLRDLITFHTDRRRRDRQMEDRQTVGKMEKGKERRAAGRTLYEKD